MGRAKVPPPTDPAVGQLAELGYRVGQAVACIDARLSAAGTNKVLVDALLDVRNLLRPPNPSP
ncbi:hypothetical protein AB0C02_27975 [Micromonospora sp. NPDC048999]|uniref:hypothetical protein n=1 Tax=Micromonospora sp. NPDC048999 TaxID=3155391 RepID=UPI0033C973A7